MDDRLKTAEVPDQQARCRSQADVLDEASKDTLKKSLPLRTECARPSLRGLGLMGLSLMLGSCFKSPFGGSYGEMGQRLLDKIVPTTTSSQSSPTAGTLAISLGDQIIARLETDLKAGGLTDEQVQTITAEARKEVQAEAGKIVITTLTLKNMGLSQIMGYDLLDLNTELMAKISSAVARGAVKSLASEGLKGLPAEFKQNTVGLLSSSVMASLTVSPQKLSDAGISSVASSLIGSLVASLPEAGFDGDQLLLGMSQVMEKAVGSLDEAGLSTEATGDAVVAVTQTTLLKATEITKGTAAEGRCVGSVASAAIQGLSSTKASATQSMEAIENVTTASVKVVVNLDSSRVDLAKSMENLTNLTTKALTTVTSASDTVSGVEKLMGAATKAAAEATASKPNDLFAKITAGIVAGSVAAVDSVVAKSGTDAASIVKSMVTTTAAKAVENSANASDAVKILTEVTGSAVKALGKSDAARDPSVKSAAVGSAIEGTVSALSKVSNQDASITSSAIQGISKAGTQAVAELTSDAQTISDLTKKIVQSGISTASTTLGGSDSTKLVSMASDMTRGAASAIATMQGVDLSAQVNSLASTAVQAVNQASSQTASASETSSVLSTFAASVASAITSGLAVGGQNSTAITTINTSLSQTIVQSVVIYAPSVDTTSLSEKVQTQAQTGADLATSIQGGGMALCAEKFSDALDGETFTSRLEGKQTGVFCKFASESPTCPKARRLANGDFYWVMTPPDLCELRPVPLSTNAATQTSSTGPATGLDTRATTSTAVMTATATSVAIGLDTTTSTATATWIGTSTWVATSVGTAIGVDLETWTAIEISTDTEIGLNTETWTSIDNSNDTLPWMDNGTWTFVATSTDTETSTDIGLGTETNTQWDTGTDTGTNTQAATSDVSLRFVSDTSVDFRWSLEGTGLSFTEISIYRSSNQELSDVDKAMQASPIGTISDPSITGFYDNGSGFGLSPNETYHYGIVGWNGFPQTHVLIGHLTAHTGPAPLGTEAPDPGGHPPLGFFSAHSQLHWTLAAEGDQLVLRSSPDNDNDQDSWTERLRYPGSGGAWENFGRIDLVTLETPPIGPTWIFVVAEQAGSINLYRFMISYEAATYVSVEPLFASSQSPVKLQYQNPRIAFRPSDNKLLIAAHKVTGELPHGKAYATHVLLRQLNSAFSGIIGQDSQVSPSQTQQKISYTLDLKVGDDNSFYLTDNGEELVVLKSSNGISWSPLSGNKNLYALESFPMNLPSGHVTALAYKTGDSGRLFVGGTFKSMDGAPQTSHIALWNGSSWMALGDGLNGPVYALALVNGDLYAGGSFTHSGRIPLNGIGRWDGEKWMPLAKGLKSYGPTEQATVYALEPSGDGGVIIGGRFQSDHDSGAPLNNIALWNGSGFAPLRNNSNQGLQNSGSILALEKVGDDLYVGGDNLQLPSGASGLRFLRYRFTSPPTWADPQANATHHLNGGKIQALAYWNGYLYVGGNFTEGQFDQDLEHANRIARWEPTSGSWSHGGIDGFGSQGSEGQILTLNVFNGELYAGGIFDKAPNNVTVENLAKTSDGTT